jgi:hypothetical protein
VFFEPACIVQLPQPTPRLRTLPGTDSSRSSHRNDSPKRDIVIGASAGGVPALMELVKGFSTSCPPRSSWSSKQPARAAEQRAALIRSVLMEDKLPKVIKPLRPSLKARERAGDKPYTRPEADPALVKASKRLAHNAQSNGRKRTKVARRSGKQK